MKWTTLRRWAFMVAALGASWLAVGSGFSLFGHPGFTIGRFGVWIFFAAIASGIVTLQTRDRPRAHRLAIIGMKTQAAHVDRAISSQIALGRLCSLFAALALIIACVGLYGTVAFSTARRTSEIGIRMALGASARRVMWMVLRDVLIVVAAGLGIGLPLILTGSRYLKSFMYGVVPNDPTSIAMGIGILLMSGLLASWVPARRASRIDPMRAVRVD